MNIRNAVKPLLPPILLSMLRGRPPIRFVGDYSTFQEAQSASTGYEAAPIVAAAVAAAEASRDLQIGPDITDSAQQILAAIGATRLTALRVLDVGGASGGYYHQLRPYLDLDWTVQETPAMVEALRPFDEPSLRFVDDTDDHYDVVLLSGVVQYADDPYVMIRKRASQGRFAIFNRLPLASRDRLTVQKIEGGVAYKGSYPAWFLSEERFFASLPGKLIMRWRSSTDRVMLDGDEIVYQGALIAL